MGRTTRTLGPATAAVAWLSIATAGGACTTERQDELSAVSGPTVGLSMDAGVDVDVDDGGEGAVDDGNDDRLDLPEPGGADSPLPCAEGGDCPSECETAVHTACDEGTTDLFAAMGLGCPGDPEVTVSVDGTLAAMGVRTGFGNTAEWAPREGTAFAVLGSGFVTDLDLATPPTDFHDNPTHCNDDLGDAYDKGATLPPPMAVADVGSDCLGDPTVLGTGDCSNTIQAQFEQGGSANDYTELRIEATVPPATNSLHYDFAFFSTEYPEYFGTGFNDMYIGWLQSEGWTGNISFDAEGNPISLNAGFLDFRDDGGTTAQLAGTCMSRHAGTRWLSTTAPVVPGEDITLVLAVFDLADSILDSYVFIDNFGWGCDGTSMPETKPVG